MRLRTNRNSEAAATVLPGDRPVAVYPKLAERVLKVDRDRISYSNKLALQTSPEVHPKLHRLERLVFRVDLAPVVRDREPPILARVQARQCLRWGAAVPAENERCDGMVGGADSYIRGRLELSCEDKGRVAA